MAAFLHAVLDHARKTGHAGGTQGGRMSQQNEFHG
jgi:hypothetical protein